MSNPLLRSFVRSLFLATSREKALRNTRGMLEKYLRLADGIDPQAAGLPIEVPPMRGVDEDMRRWSFFMVLEHNAIVNRTITTIVQQLSRGEPLSGAARIHPKTGVMPAADTGLDAVASFRDSVEDHLAIIPTLGALRGTKTAPHPVFGPFDAHKWHCMFAFHLSLHYPQALHVARESAASIAR